MLDLQCWTRDDGHMITRLFEEGVPPCRSIPVDNALGARRVS